MCVVNVAVPIISDESFLCTRSLLSNQEDNDSELRTLAFLTKLLILIEQQIFDWQADGAEKDGS